MKKNIVIIGMPGSGKTTFSKMLAEKLNMNFVDADEFIEQSENKTIKEFFAVSEECFRDAETRCSESLSKLSSHVIATGGGVVKREINIDFFKKSSVIVFINRPVEQIVQDIDSDSRPLLVGHKERIFNLYAERIDLYKKYCDIEIDNSGDKSETLNKILEQLELIG